MNGSKNDRVENDAGKDDATIASSTGNPGIAQMKTEVLKSVADFMDLEESIRQAQEQNPQATMAYRGQPREFGTLAPSFRRQFERESFVAAELIEQKLIEAFRSHYEVLPDRSNDMPGSNVIGPNFELSCLSVMQHYEIPTRLLDWTADIWTAAYFACASDPSSDAELWMYDRRLFQLPDASFIPANQNEFLLARDNAHVAELDIAITPRMQQQKAHHTVCSDVFADHAPLLLRLAKSAGDFATRDETGTGEGDQDLANPDYQAFRRFKIEGACKGKMLQFLATQKEITAGTIFPDVVGLGRFLRWQFESLRTMML